MKKRITFDFETRSMADLKKVGAFKYSLDPTTRPTCLAAKFHGQKAMMFLTFEEVYQPWQKVPQGFRYHWQRALDNDFEFSAHNAFFERCIYENVLVKRMGWPHIPFTSYRCTAAKAAACALPRNLAGAGEALGLNTQKYGPGYSAMMATCKPTKKYNAWVKVWYKAQSGKKLTASQQKIFDAGKPPTFLEPQHDIPTWETLYKYCGIDVRSEEELDDALPDLSPTEQEIWQLNQTLNWRGVRVDVPMIEKIVKLMGEETSARLDELDTLTLGIITKAGARASILEFLAIEGVELPNLQAKTVGDALAKEGINEDAKQLLEIRKALSKTSTRKYQSLLDRAENRDYRLRDILLYHGASTGRDTGTGVQLHNLPKRLISQAEVEEVLEILAGIEARP